MQAGLTAATAAAAFTVALGSPPPPAAAVTNEQLLYLEAWRAVDRAYVDKTFNGTSWFKVLPLLNSGRSDRSGCASLSVN